MTNPKNPWQTLSNPYKPQTLLHKCTWAVLLGSHLLLSRCEGQEKGKETPGLLTALGSGFARFPFQTPALQATLRVVPSISQHLSQLGPEILGEFAIPGGIVGESGTVSSPTWSQRMVSFPATITGGVCWPLALPQLCFCFKTPFKGFKSGFQSCSWLCCPRVLSSEYKWETDGDGEFPMVHEPKIPTVIPVKPD